MNRPMLNVWPKILKMYVLYLKFTSYTMNNLIISARIGSFKCNLQNWRILNGKQMINVLSISLVPGHCITWTSKCQQILLRQMRANARFLVKMYSIIHASDSSIRFVCWYFNELTPSIESEMKKKPKYLHVLYDVSMTCHNVRIFLRENMKTCVENYVLNKYKRKMFWKAWKWHDSKFIDSIEIKRIEYVQYLRNC